MKPQRTGMSANEKTAIATLTLGVATIPLAYINPTATWLAVVATATPIAIRVVSWLTRRLVPNAEKAILHMTPVSIKPEPRLPGDTRSELLVVGQYVPGGNLTLFRELVFYCTTDGAWLRDRSRKPVDMEITHWLKASEQSKLN